MEIRNVHRDVVVWSRLESKHQIRLISNHRANLINAEDNERNTRFQCYTSRLKASQHHEKQQQLLSHRLRTIQRVVQLVWQDFHERLHRNSALRQREGSLHARTE